MDSFRATSAKFSPCFNRLRICCACSGGSNNDPPERGNGICLGDWWRDLRAQWKTPEPDTHHGLQPLCPFDNKAELRTQRTRSRMPGIFSTVGSQDYIANRLLQGC